MKRSKQQEEEGGSVMLGLFDKLAIADLSLYSHGQLVQEQDISLDEIASLSVSTFADARREAARAEIRGGVSKRDEEEEQEDIFTDDLDIEFNSAVRRAKFRPLQLSRRPVHVNGEMRTESVFTDLPLSVPSRGAVSSPASPCTSLATLHGVHGIAARTETGTGTDMCKEVIRAREVAEARAEDVTRSELVHFECLQELWHELESTEQVTDLPFVVINHIGQKLSRSVLNPLPKTKLGLGKGAQVGESTAHLPQECVLEIDSVRSLCLDRYLGVGTFGHVLSGVERGKGSAGASGRQWEQVDEGCRLAAKIDSGTAHTLWEAVLHLRLSRRIDRHNRAVRGRHSHYFLYPTHVLRYANASVLVMPLAELGSVFTCLLALHGSSCFTAADREVCVAALVMQMLEAVDFLHAHHVVHTDVKLDNFCLRASSGGTLQLCLIDFGKAKDLIDGEGRVRNFRGSSAISSMTSFEMARGDVWVYHADYFALCCCMHTLLWGEELTSTMELPEARARRGFSCENADALRCPKVSLPRYWNRALWSHLYLTLLYAEPNPTKRANVAGLCASLDNFLGTHGEQLTKIYTKLIVALSQLKK